MTSVMSSAADSSLVRPTRMGASSAQVREHSVPLSTEGDGEYSAPHSAEETLDRNALDDLSEEESEDDRIAQVSTVGNIRDELAIILEDDLEFNGEFSFYRAYPSAPNPSLNIDDLGTIGLPLSLRDAAAIKLSSEQAPFGKADQTIVDKSVRDTWEIDAQRVQFENPAWQSFLDDTVRDACEALGVDFEASKPRCELYKLLLYEAGSHFLPHVDTEKADGMFATLVIVLPSRFTGGTVRVSHGDTSKVYDHCVNSLNETTVLAWYTDVEHAVKQITSGYRLALSFNLIHTARSLRPTAPDCSISSDLRRILLSWKNTDVDEDAPKKIIRLLDHKYSEATLSRSGCHALKGPDAHLLALLKDVATPLGFQMGLANLHFTQTGQGTESGWGSRRNKGRDEWGYDRWGKWGYNPDPEPVNNSDVQMAYVESEVVEIKHLVDLDGDLIRRSLEYALEEIIPDGLIEEITSGEHDEQEYEGYMGNYGGSLERHYRRTVLVIWPKWANFDLIHGPKAFSVACDQLRASTSQEPTEEEAELTDIVLARSNASRAKDVVSSVCHVALAWKDFSLWFRAVRACDAEKSLDTLQVNNILQAVATFGFDEVQPCLERTIERDPCNTRVLKFMERFEEWVESQGSDELTALTASWSEILRDNRLDELKVVAHDEPKLLIAAVLKYRGLEFLEKSILPLVKQCSDSLLLLTHAVTLYDAGGVPAETRSRMAKDVLRECLSNVDFYPVIQHKQQSTHQAPYRHGLSDESQQLEKAKPYLRACIALGCVDLFPVVVERLLALDDLAEDLQHQRVKHVLLPLAAYVVEIARSTTESQPVADFRKLCEEAVSLFLRNFVTKPQNLTQADVSFIIQATVKCGQLDLVLTGIIPKLEALDLKNTQLREIVEELHAQRGIVDPSGTNLNPVLLRLLKNWMSTTSLTIPVHPTQYAYGTSSADRVKPAVDALDFCLKVSLPEACVGILDRLLNPPALDIEYIKTQLAPLLPDLRGLLVKHKHPLTSPLFTSTFRTIMLYWVERVLGPRPLNTVSKHLEAIRNWQCSCNICPAVRDFLTSDAAESKEWQRIGAPKRGHVEKLLQSYAREVATYSTIRTTPQGLKVTKLPAIVAPARWVQHQKQGLVMLKSISADPAEIQAILGSQHAQISALLQGRGPDGAAKPISVPSSGLADTVVPQAVGDHNTVAAATASSSHSKQPSTDDTVRKTGKQKSQTRDKGTASTAMLPTSDNGPPAKRRRTAYGERDVIDLT